MDALLDFAFSLKKQGELKKHQENEKEERGVERVGVERVGVERVGVERVVGKKRNVEKVVKKEEEEEEEEEENEGWDWKIDENRVLKEIEDEEEKKIFIISRGKNIGHIYLFDFDTSETVEDKISLLLDISKRFIDISMDDIKKKIINVCSLKDLIFEHNTYKDLCLVLSRKMKANMSLLKKQVIFEIVSFFEKTLVGYKKKKKEEYILIFISNYGLVEKENNEDSCNEMEVKIREKDREDENKLIFLLSTFDGVYFFPTESSSTMTERGHRNIDMEWKDFTTSYMKKNTIEKFECEYNNTLLSYRKKNDNKKESRTDVQIDTKPLRIIHFLKEDYLNSLSSVYFKIAYYFFNHKDSKLLRNLSRYKAVLKTNEKNITVHLDANELLRYIHMWDFFFNPLF